MAKTCCCTVYHAQQYVDHQAHGILSNHRVTIVLPLMLSAIVAQACPQLHDIALHLILYIGCYQRDFGSISWLIV